jgi:U3 small nucleolar RNA-associated protein 19
MVKSSLGSASASHSKRPATVPASSKSAAVSPTQLILNQITLLSSQLPPTINTANLNPLADLLTLFNELPLTLSEKRNASEEEGGRRVLITSLLALKTIFEALIEKGRMHGILKSSSNKRSKVEEVKEEKEATSVEKVKEWLNSRYQDYCRRLVEIMTGHWDNTIRVSCQSDLTRPITGTKLSVGFTDFSI